MLGRSIFEDMIDLHWVAQNKTEAVQRFNDDAMVAKALQATRIETYLHLLPNDALRRRAEVHS